ncbi:MAG: hypothetical protein ABIE55_02070 [Candidatus Aenigmatarchaeota archaeon]
MRTNLLVFGSVFLIFLVFFAAITLISTTLVLAAANDTVTIDVNVTEAAAIVVIPDTLNWTSVATGQVGGIKNLTVKNAGSINVTQIYAYIDTLVTEIARPYGSSDPLDFSAGGVITLRNETDTKYYFAGRIEWNWTQDIPNHDWSALTTSDATAWGYFRNTSSDYVWVLGNGTAGRCNETNTQFSVETDVDIGTTGTRTPTNTISITASSNDPNNWGYGSMITGPLTGHCVAVTTNCDKIFIYNFDRRSNFTDCANTDYLFAGNLTPGSTFITRVDAWVPNGYPAGFLNQTTLTVYASS